MFTDKTAERHIKELIFRYPTLQNSAEDLDRVYNTLKNCFFKDHILFCAGNGGSASDCEHIVGELMKDFVLKRTMPDTMRNDFIQAGSIAVADRLQMGLRCISLLSHPSLNSAFSNDADPVMIYAQQLFVLGRQGDVILGISTSGNAENLKNAFQVARARQITTVLLTGLNHGACEPFADLILRAPAMETYKIQEYHLPLYHCLCLMLEEAFYGNK